MSSIFDELTPEELKQLFLQVDKSERDYQRIKRPNSSPPPIDSSHTKHVLTSANAKTSALSNLINKSLGSNVLLSGRAIGSDSFWAGTCECNGVLFYVDEF